jgi:putative heme-binding domain-containing protein
MIAVDQMDVDGGNDPNAVAALLTSPDQPLKEAASWIIGRHPEWAEALAGILRSRLTEGGLNAADLTELERQLAKFAATPEIQALLAERLAEAGSPRSVKLACLHAMEQADLKSPPKTWLEPITRALGDPDSEIVAQAVATAKALRPAPEDAPALLAALKAIGGQVQATASLRLAALSAVPEGLVAPAPEVFTFLAAQLGKDQPAGNRSAAAEILARAKLSPAQLEALTAAVREAGPIEVDRLLTAFEQTDDEAIGLKLVQAMLDSSALSSLRIDLVKQHLAKFGPKVANAAEALYHKLNANIAGQKARIDELMGKIAQGDIRRGQAVFHSEKAACYTCHAIGYRGGNVGPDLTKVGGVRAERDLLEAIVFPSASLIRSYEPVVVATADGKVYNGLLRNETSDEIRLVTGANQEARIARDEIEEIRPSTVSVMPAGLDQQLTVQELADLIAFLKACR